MMTGAPQHIEIFVTHVAEDGPLLKIWGQLDRSAATFVERLIVQYTQQFDRGAGVVYPQSLSVDQLCCAKYGEDGMYYRAKIADISTVQQGYVRVNFIDYGNSDMIDINNIRSLQILVQSPLCSIQDQATEFTLAGVVPPMGVGWDQASVDFVREKLCYAEFRCAIVAQISGRRLITLYYHDTDFSEILIQKNLAIRITLHAQQAMFHNMQYQLSNSTSSYNYSVPPPTVSVNYPTSASMLVKTAAITKQESGVISAPILSVGSKHEIYISNVEDGPYLFAVQLKASENILQNMTRTFSHVPLKPFSQSPIPGSACVSLLPQAKVLCRAVVTNLMEKECVVYCVDFGNTETVPFSQIYEMPSQFLHTKSLAMRFCLAGIQNSAFDDKAKRLFQELVKGETLTLEVVEPEGPPLKQYGNIYLRNENVVNVLKAKLKDLQKTKAYPQLPAIQPGRVVSVTVSFVESADNFYVQYEANAKALSKIMSTMMEYCTKIAVNVRANELHVGLPVCALFSGDQLWYRARILSITGDQINVFYVDYGNTDTVSLTSLRHMDLNLSQAQAQAVACCLAGFEAAGEDLSNRFEELTLERKLTMKIVTRLTTGKLIVELHDTTVAPIVNIGLLLLAPPKNITFEETPIDEWHDPASGEPAAIQSNSSQFGKERSKREDGGGEGWRTENKRSGGYENPDSSKKWGNRDDRNRNDRKWGRDDQSEGQNRWGKEADGNSGRDNNEERGGNRKWESSDSRGNNEKSWERRGFNKEGGDWKDRDNKRGFSRDEEEWKDKDNKRSNDNWKDRDNNRRGFNKDGDDWKSRDNNKRGFERDGDDWKSRDNNKRGFDRDGDDRKDRDNNRRFNKDSEDRNWRKREDQGQEGRKWWGHDDRGEPEKKWGGKDGGEDNRKWGGKEGGDDNRKWGGRDKRSNTGEFKKWNDGDRGFKRNDSWKDKGGAASEQNWGISNAVTNTGGEEEWGTDETSVVGTQNVVGGDTKSYCEASVVIGAKETVTLTSADDPTNFVVQVDSKLDELTAMMEKIATLYETGGTVIPEADQKILSPCVTRYSEDNGWYRAVITNAPSEGVTEVRFVDYGNHESVSSSDIKEVVSEFLSIPQFGISCSLFAVQVPVAEWSSDEITEFLNTSDGKSLEAHFIKKEGPLFEVVLYDVEDKNSSINEKFGASNASIEDGMSKKNLKAATPPKSIPPSFTPFKLSESEVVYASSDDRFSVFEFSPETTDTVTVTWFINPDQFYCQRSLTKTEFSSMVNDIQTAYKKRTSFKGELEVGMPVIAQFPADKVLYRAEVKELKGVSYQVQYVDYGNMELLIPSNIWQIEKRFMELPKQAIECCVSGIKPVESEWPKDSSEFDKLFGAESLECIFHDTKDGKNCVSLLNNGKDVAEELVTGGLAVRKVEERVVPEERLAMKLLKGQQLPAHVSFIESVSKFFVHLDPAVAKTIQSKVDAHMTENMDTAPILPSDMVEHQLCLASPDGTQWFRGKIIDTSGTVGVCVSFIDFGDSDDVPVDRVRPIPEALMGFRHQATECSVVGSDVNEVSKDIEETFKVEVETQDVILSIEDVNERLSVHLFDVEGQRLELLKNVDKSSPLDVEPLCPMPILIHTARMWVSHVEKLNEVWLQKETDVDILSGLLELLFNFYEEEAKGEELGDPQTDQLCAAKSGKDSSWYRARVKELVDEQIHVTYIDYGNSETLSKEDVKELDPSFCRIPALAICAVLAATPVDLETSLAEFEKVSGDTVFDVSFVRDTEDKWVVHLENDDVNVIHNLMKSGLVSEIDLFQSEQVSLPVSEKIDVSISHFDSSAEFWVQMDSNFLDILELQQTLQLISPSQAVLDGCDVGTKCIAQFSDEAWYRAKVLESDGTSVKVQFLDYGNAYETVASSLKKLPVKVFRWPYFAVRCRLSDESFLEDVDLAEKCTELLSDTDAVFQLQVIGGNDPALVSLFVGEKELQQAVIDRKEAQINAVCVAETVEAVPTDPPESEAVLVSHVSSPAKFWIQKEEASSELQNLADLLAPAVDFEAVSEVQIGSTYAALFEDDEQWYRAKILELCENSYNVLFIDYGNSSIVSDLRVLPEEMVKMPAVAKCCWLQMPVGVEEWSAEADKKLVELSEEGTVTFQMTVLSSEEPYQVKLSYNGSDVSKMLGELCVSCVKAPSEGVLNATITHINHPSEFWIHWEMNSSKLESVTDNLIDAENFDPLEEYSDGLVCVAQFPEDEQWYRARIISCQDQGIEMFFIDYGNTAFVSEVRSIPQDLVSIPPLAKHCSLPLPNGLEKWPEKAEDEFINIFGDGTNSYEVTVLCEGDPSVVNLEFNGSKVFDMLQQCCQGTISGKLSSSEVSCSSSSTEVEILSETEIIIDPTDSVIDENVHLLEGELVIKSKQVGDSASTCEIAEDLLNELLENSMSADPETNKLKKSIIDDAETPSEDVLEEGILNPTVQEYESPDVAASILNELIETLTSECAEVTEKTEELEVHDDNGPSEISEDQEVQEVQEDNGPSEISEVQESSEDQETEHAAPKKSEIIPSTKHGVEHCEKIIRDFSVEMQTPNKGTEGPQGTASIPWCSSPVRKLSHAERIVPGSISRGMSPIELELSEDQGKELLEHLIDSSVNLPNDTKVSDSKVLDHEHLESDEAVPVNEGKLLDNSDDLTEEEKSQYNDETQTEAEECKNEKSEKITSSVHSSLEQEVTGTADLEMGNTYQTDSEVPNILSPLSGSPQKSDHDASGSTINENTNLTSDISESNSISTASSSSPQKDTRSTELESEMSGDVSGSLYEESDSSANCTLMNSSFAGSSKHIGIDEDKMKCYEFAQMHASEEYYESSKSNNANSAKAEITNASKPESGKPSIEEEII